MDLKFDPGLQLPQIFPNKNSYSLLRLVSHGVIFLLSIKKIYKFMIFCLNCDFRSEKNNDLKLLYVQVSLPKKKSQYFITIARRENME